MPLHRGVPSTSAGFMYLDLLFGKKELDDRKLRRPVELINDLLLRFGRCAASGEGDMICGYLHTKRKQPRTGTRSHQRSCPEEVDALER